MKKNKGFTLIELMIVVAIIAIIAAIAIPNLLRSKLQSNESAAQGNIRTIVGAQVTYHSANYAYAADLATLAGGTPPFLDGDWAQTKQGYDFTCVGTGTNFGANAVPAEVEVSGGKAFFADASGVIRWVAGAGPADGTSPAIGQTV